MSPALRQASPSLRTVSIQIFEQTIYSQTERLIENV